MNTKHIKIKTVLKATASHLHTDRKFLVAGGVIMAALLVMLLMFRSAFTESEIEHGTLLWSLGVIGALSAGILGAVKIELPQKYRQIYSIVFFFLMPFLAMFMSECIQGVFIYNFSPLSTLANYILFLMLYAVIMLITGTFRIPVIIMTPVIFIFSLAASLILLFRGTPLMPADILSIGTGLDVAAGYHFTMSAEYVLGVIVFVIIEILAFRMPSYERRKHSAMCFRLISLIFIAAIAIPFYTTDVAANHGLKPDFWDQERGYHRSGTILNFVLNTKYLIIERPEEYDADEVPSVIQTVLSENEDDEGIFISAQAAQELRHQAQMQAEAEASQINTEQVDTDTDATTAVDETDETSVPELPNTGLNTALAVQGQSSLMQPKTSAKLRKNQVPNIIVIMNETYSDLRVLGQFATNQDYMPFTRSLTKNTIKGNLYMPVNGAGTSNSEFEFLTGNSMAFLTGGSNAYELYVKSRIPSLAYTLEAQGYSRTALHAYYGSSWKRDVNYPLMGFENFISLEDFIDEDLVNSYRNGDISFSEYEEAAEAQYPDEQVLLRRFVSDSFDYKQLEDIYENRDQDRPFFMFNVTMQNHGGYDASYSNFDQQIQITSVEDGEYYPRSNRFLSLIYEADAAFEELIDYFSSVKEPTIILMFGDHQPSIEEEFIEKLLGSSLTDLTTEQKQKRYITPFILWANYDIEEGYIDMISSNYLSTLLMQTAGLKTTAYMDYASAIYRIIPVIDTTGYITADGSYHTYDEENEYSDILKGYEKIQYNNLFDALERHDELFYITE